VVYLPFKEDVRDVVLKGAAALPCKVDTIDRAKDVITKLTVNYYPKNFPNPVLQTHWRAIEALALNEDDIEPYDDSSTQPDYEAIEAKAGYDLYSINQMLGASNVPISETKVKVPENMKELAINGQVFN
jgi:ATP-dependent DNA helicase 2 subunit 1